RPGHLPGLLAAGDGLAGRRPRGRRGHPPAARPAVRRLGARPRHRAGSRPVTALVMAALSAREVGRRRTVVLLVVALPLWFYLVRRGQTGQSVRMLTMGIGWAVSTVTLFVVNAARSLDPRLRLTGARASALVGGRLLALTGGG